VASFRQGTLFSVFPVEKMAPTQSVDAMTPKSALGLEASLTCDDQIAPRVMPWRETPWHLFVKALIY
jgi:hypothetical protein